MLGLKKFLDRKELKLNDLSRREERLGWRENLRRRESNEWVDNKRTVLERGDSGSVREEGRKINETQHPIPGFMSSGKGGTAQPLLRDEGKEGLCWVRGVGPIEEAKLGRGSMWLSSVEE